MNIPEANRHRLYMLHRMTVCLVIWLPVIPSMTSAQAVVLLDRLVHIRATGSREWADMPEQAEFARYEQSFAHSGNDKEFALRYRQRDVKQEWRVLLNGNELGRLIQDENDLTTVLAVPPGTLRDGTNTLTVEQVNTVPDDIRLGDVILYPRSRKEILTETEVDLEIRDTTGTPVPARITIVDTNRSLMAVTAAEDAVVASRPGMVYTGNGRASIRLPAGAYTLYATKGPEYGVDSTRIELGAGRETRLSFTLHREVDTNGWIGFDPHVHTLTFSGHGDAGVEERMLTLAGEGLDAAVMTEHNLQVDVDSVARRLGVRPFFTPITGNEVTTRVGHFNVFPMDAGATPPDPDVSTWEVLVRRIGPTEHRVVILNHGRDVHNGFTPFGPDRFLAPAGVYLDGWTFPIDGVEVINSGSQQNDPFQLLHDWFGLLNHGLFVAPVGSSDSHDVGRYLVGQGRTYVAGNDARPGSIEPDEVVAGFKKGRVSTGFGLFVDIDVNESYGPGDLVPAADSLHVTVDVRHPGWIAADSVVLFVNGRPFVERPIKNRKDRIRAVARFTLPRPLHDLFLVALARGPDPKVPFWPIARPYQSTSPFTNPHVFGVTGAVWIDGDGDGKRSTARDYAERLVAGGNVQRLVRALAAYDEAVAVQAFALLHGKGVRLEDLESLPLSVPIRNALAKVYPRLFH